MPLLPLAKICVYPNFHAQGLFRTLGMKVGSKFKDQSSYVRNLVYKISTFSFELPSPQTNFEPGSIHFYISGA